MMFLGRVSSVIAASLLFTVANAGNMGPSSHRWLPNGNLTVQSGFFSAKQNHNQHVNIQDLIGDGFLFNNSNNNQTNALVGLAYYLPGPSMDFLDFEYGLNVFYFLQTKVSGYVTQEDLYTNLSYQYNVTNVPIFLAAKAVLPCLNARFPVTLDAGIGPNVIITSSFGERSLDGVTIPDNIFKGNTITTYAVMARVSLRANQLRWPVECGYQFTYSGPGNLEKINNQVISNLNTGNSYSNSLVCGVVFG